MTAAEMDIIIGAEVQGAVNGLKQVNAQLVKTEQTATKFTQKGKTDFTNLGRVIQDLPFGFIAIQNNLTQLLPAAGGLGLAISVLTSAIAFAQVGFSNWTRGLGQTKEELDEVSKSVAGAQTEIVKISSLLSIARGLGESTQARTNAIKELQKEYPGYLGNLTLENINSQETSHAVDMLSQALTRKAKVQAISNLLTKANEKLLQAEGTTIQENILSVNAFLGLMKKGIFGAGQGIIAGATKETVDNIIDAREEIKQLSNTLAELTQEQARNSDFSLLSPTAPKKIKDLANSFALVNTNIKGISEKFIGAIAVETGNNMGEVQKVLDKNPLELKFKPMEEVDKTMTKIAEATGFISSSFDKIFGSLGNSGNVFASITDGLKGLIIDLTKTLIKAAAVAVILNALGLGAFTIGSIFSQLAGLGSLLKFATGGVVTKPTLALVGEQGPERITPLGYEGRSNNVMQGEVVFQISGQSLRGILRRADQTAFNTF